ncbi:MAG: hypothetical protein EA383_16250 [Spirochaetaceae bacterium]|nr:MAG: hypothetical protein EA383_16250 [Spirochaetaceae bacterium]
MTAPASQRVTVRVLAAIGLLFVAAATVHTEPAPASVDDVARYYLFDYHRLEGRTVFSLLAEQSYRNELARRNWRGFYATTSLPTTFGYFTMPLATGVTNLRLGPLSFSGDVDMVFGSYSEPNTIDDLTFSTGTPRVPSGSRFYENGEWSRVYRLATSEGGFPGMIGVRGEAGWRSMATFSFLYRTQNYSSIDPSGVTEEFNDTVYEWGLALHPQAIFNSTNPVVPQSVTVRAIQQDAQLDGYVGAVTTPDLPYLELVSFGRTNVLDRYFGSAYVVTPNRLLSTVVNVVSEEPFIRSIEAGINIATLIAPQEISRMASEGTIIDWNVGLRYDQYTPWQQALFLAPESHLAVMFQVRLLTLGGGIDSDLLGFLQLFNDESEFRILPVPLALFLGIDF